MIAVRRRWARRTVVALTAALAGIGVPRQASAQPSYGPELATTPSWSSGVFALLDLGSFDPSDPDAVPRFIPPPPNETSQDIDTDPLTSYLVSFDYEIRHAQFGPAQLTAWWGGTQLFAVGPAHGPDHFALLLSGAGDVTPLRFHHTLLGTECVGWTCDEWGSVVTIDNISVRPLLATPEPATLVLTAAGLALVGGLARRGRRGGA